MSPVMQNPWDQCPIEPHGDGDVDQIYLAVGRALSTWETLEENLGRVFAALCGSNGEGPARAYGAVSSNSGRTDMIREAFSCSHVRSKSSFATFPKFLERVGKYGTRRNEIAHGVARSFNVNSVDKGCYLCPASYHSRKTLSSTAYMDSVINSEFTEQLIFIRVFGKYAYTSNQINYYTDRFSKLNSCAIHFWMDLIGMISPEDVQNVESGDPS
jgi:hypothetical protein